MSEPIRPSVFPTGRPGEYYVKDLDRTILLHELRLVRRDRPMPKGATVCKVQPASYRDRVKMARAWATDGYGNFDGLEFRRLYPNSKHSLLVEMPIGR